MAMIDRQYGFADLARVVVKGLRDRKDRTSLSPTPKELLAKAAENAPGAKNLLHGLGNGQITIRPESLLKGTISDVLDNQGALNALFHSPHLSWLFSPDERFLHISVKRVDIQNDHVVGATIQTLRQSEQKNPIEEIRSFSLDKDGSVVYNRPASRRPSGALSGYTTASGRKSF